MLQGEGDKLLDTLLVSNILFHVAMFCVLPLDKLCFFCDKQISIYIVTTQHSNWLCLCFLTCKAKQEKKGRNFEIYTRIVANRVGASRKGIHTSNSLWSCDWCNCDPSCWIAANHAYRPGYSTETALLRVFDTILYELDQGNAVFLSLLDMSSAFDTVDHRILLARLKRTFNFTDRALEWITSYLPERTAKVFVLGAYSEPKPLTCSVPQGSILCAGLYSDYTQPLGLLIATLLLLYHLYADDCQVFKSFNTRKPDEQDDTASDIENGIACINSWTSNNRLCSNPDKTEFNRVFKYILSAAGTCW